MTKLQIEPITLKEANQFVESFHRHNKPTQGGLFAICATYDNEMVGVAIVGRPIARMLQDGYTAEITRVCVTDDAPKNTNSFLYSAAWRAARALGYRKAITYTLQDESGASLRGAGWAVVNQVPPRPEGWQRSEPGQSRKWQPIFGQLKFRWEVTA